MVTEQQGFLFTVEWVLESSKIKNKGKSKKDFINTFIFRFDF